LRKVLFCSFESLPFVKTGGLADVVYALPKAIDNTKYEVKVVLPLLKKIKDKYWDKLEYVDHISVHSGYINEEANIKRYVNEGIEYLFIENDTFFYRDEVYGFDDDVSRFSFFNVAILEMMIKLNYYPDILHCHDYHTGVLAALCKARYYRISEIQRIKHVYTIHNLVYQGEYNKQVLFDLLGFDYKLWRDGSIKYKDYCNFMKIAINFSDVITTVSNSYANEIQTSEFGHGLEGILRENNNRLYGIVNGIDTDLFDPNTDKIFKNYNLKNYLKGKVDNKTALQKELGLEVDEKKFLVGMVTRLTFQKGLELVSDSLDWILKNENVQLVILGTGEEKYEHIFRNAEENHKGKVVFYRGYNEALAHSIYAGIDMLLMPSLFEPCGISQLISMRYGTLPLVRETGGLKDTVEPYNEVSHTGRGFSFNSFDGNAFRTVFDYAFKTYWHKRKDWNMLIRNAMNYDVSFTKSAREYEKIYDSLID